MSKIGIFWIHSGVVFGKAVGLQAGVEAVPGKLDSPDNHADVWERERPWAVVSAALFGVEYEEVPRGRVLFLSRQQRPLVYADKVLMNPANWLIIAEFFEFGPSDAHWRSDDHYTTAKGDLDALFSNEGW